MAQLDEMKRRAEELLEQGASGGEIQRKIREEFDAKISCSWLYPRIHERDGTTPTPRPKLKKKTKKKGASTKKKKVEKPVSLVRTKAIEVPAAPLSSRGVDGLLVALLRAMRTEGVDSVMLRADGRATIYHVVSRELQIS